MTVGKQFPAPSLNLVSSVDWSSAAIKVFQPADATTPVLTLGPVDPVP
jgi:hypothetical protein